MSADDAWRKAPVIYEIYPRSFADTTGTGIGDLKGITERLDHVASLGVDAIWLCPFFVSPLDDGGYDIVDHRAVAPRYGTMEDFDALVARAHALGLKVLVDQIYNHTSCHHPKFEAAIAGDEREAACYLWRDPKPDGTPPNNWLSQFGPPAWTWEHRRRQYYLHQFLDCQPSLNLRNPRVVEMHCETINFWLDHGVDGFRLDAVTSYLYDETLADNPPARPIVQDRVSGPNYNPYTYQDHVYDMLPGDGAAFAETVRSWVGDDVFLLGESTSGNQSLKLAMDFSEPGRLDFCYTHDAIHGARSAQAMADLLRDLDGRWRLPWWFSCHDQPRHNSKLGDGTPESAKFFALLLAVMPGPVLLYQGEELGLSQPQLSFDENTDPFDRLYWPDPPGREGPRVPIPWTEDGPTRGFTDGTPWLPMRWPEGSSVAAQSERPDSVLAFYRAVFGWRRETGIGVPDDLAAEASDSVLSVTIMLDGASWNAVFNFSPEADLPVPSRQGQAPEMASGWDGTALAPWGAAIWPDGAARA